MKFVHRPQRRRATQGESRIALFPFLAVLICTMGTLVPLLMVISYFARNQAKSDALAKVAEQAAEVQTRLEDTRWRIEMIQQSRAKTEAQLADARLQLGHLEDHARRLRAEFERHRKTLADLDSLDQNERQGSETEAELQRLRGEIDAAARQLDGARKEAAAQKPCYAIVPYEGPNQTYRPPIYIECRGDAVVLQPEGIELTESDFEGPPGPGNPLAAAMRAAREYLLAQPNFDLKAGEPYPLLLVRPDGINAYYVAREAMASWGSDFGYELIGDDWRLAFPTPDPRLTQVVRQAVTTARADQARLAAAAPSYRGVRGKVVYRAAPGGGGFIREEAPADADSGRYQTVRPAGPVAEKRGNARGAGIGGPEAGEGGNGFGNAEPGTGVAGGELGNRYGGSGPTGHTGGGNSQYPTNNSAVGNAADATVNSAGEDRSHAANGSAPGDASGTTKRPATAVAGSGYGDSSGASNPGGGTDSNPLRGTPGGDSSQSQNPLAGSGRNNGRPEGYVVGQPPSEQDAAGRQTAGGGRPRLPGEWQPASESSHGSPGAEGKDGPPPSSAGGCSIEKSLSAKRGQDWGLRNTSRGSVGIRRPIRVECYPDRLVVLSDRDPSGNKAVKLGTRVEPSIDLLISAVWDQMESWGIAGRNMYWRPVLRVSVAPGAQRRFDELAALLEGSGLLVEKK